MNTSQAVVYSEAVEVEVGTGSSWGFSTNYTNVEAGFVTSVKAYSANEVPFAPSGKVVVAQAMLISSFLLLADEQDDKWSNFPLRDLNPYLQTTFANIVPDLRVRLSGRSRITCSDPSVLVANVGRVFYLRFDYRRAK